MEPFEGISEITDIETIAIESSIDEVSRLRKQYGQGRWRKLKGVALIRLRSGRVRKVELHWYRSIWHRKKRDQTETLFGIMEARIRR
jgi:hypothetical protein